MHETSVSQLNISARHDRRAVIDPTRTYHRAHPLPPYRRTDCHRSGYPPIGPRPAREAYPHRHRRPAETAGTPGGESAHRQNFAVKRQQEVLTAVADDESTNGGFVYFDDDTLLRELQASAPCPHGFRYRQYSPPEAHTHKVGAESG